MDTNSQVILVLKLALNIAPPALYFVILGLVNSQSRPHLISSRSDWVTLISVFCPVLLFPAMWLAAGGHYLTGLLAVAIVALGVYFSLPRPRSGWVVYNCSRIRLFEALVAALSRGGIEFQVVDSQQIRLPRHQVDLKLSGMPLLKNMTISVISQDEQGVLTAQLERHLRDQLDEVETNVNPSGPALLVTGTSMLILPLLMMVRHMNAFVRVVSDLWPV